MQPYEIIAGPINAWVAPVGEAVPEVDTEPAGNWTKLGTSGSENITEDGVTVTHSQEISKFFGLGATGPKKAWRTQEGLAISFTLADLTMEMYAKILNDNTVTQVAAGTGTPGHKDVNLAQGREVAVFALLCRGVSPYGDAFNMQYEVPKVHQATNPAPVYVKGEAAGLAISFEALWDDTQSDGEEFGKIVAQDAAAQ